MCWFLLSVPHLCVFFSLVFCYIIFNASSDDFWLGNPPPGAGLELVMPTWNLSGLHYKNKQQPSMVPDPIPSPLSHSYPSQAQDNQAQ